MSPQPLSITTNLFTFMEQEMAFAGPYHLPKILGQKVKTNYKGTLDEPSIIKEDWYQSTISKSVKKGWRAETVFTTFIPSICLMVRCIALNHVWSTFLKIYLYFLFKKRHPTVPQYNSIAQLSSSQGPLTNGTGCRKAQTIIPAYQITIRDNLVVGHLKETSVYFYYCLITYNQQ